MFATALLAACAGLTLRAFQTAQPRAAAAAIRVGSELDFRPYAFLDKDGRPAGFSVDLVRAVGQAMGLRLEVTPGSWDEVWKRLVKGEIDVLPVVAKLPGREALVDFSVPHTETYDAFFVRRGEPPPRDLPSARGKSILVMRSDAAHHALLESGFSHSLVLVDTIPEGLALLAAGRHDALLCSKLIGTLEIRQHGIKGIIVGPPVPDYKRTFAFAVRKGNAELLEKLNQGLLIVKTNGEYDRIYSKWLSAEDPWRAWRRYLVPALATTAASALTAGLLVLLLQWLVRTRTRQLRRANQEIEAEMGERRKAEAALQELNRTLERRVAARTSELQATEARYRSLFNAMTEGFALHRIVTDEQGRPRDYVFIDVNPAFETLTGLSREGLLGKRVREVIPDIEPRWIDAYGRVALTGQPVHLEEHAAALKRWFEAFAYQTAPGEFAVVFTDITERRQTEEALRRKEALLRAVLDNSPDPIFLKDREGRLQLANRATFAVLGKPAEQAIGKTDLDLYDDPETGRAIMENDRRVMESGGMEVVEETVRASSGNRVYLSAKAPYRDEQGNVIGLIGVTREITKRKRVEEALRESERRFRLALHNAPVSVAVQDRDLRYVWAYNQRTAGPEEIVGKQDADLFTPEEAARLSVIKRRVLHEQVEVREQMWLDRPGGRTFLDVYFEPIHDEAGNSVGVGIATVDLTAMKAAEEAAREANQRLEEADRRKNEFLAILSHELRNPLAPITTALYLLDHAPPGGELASRAKGIISRQVAQLSNLINDLLDVTRITRNKVQLQRERLELNEVVARTVEDNRALFEAAGVSLEWHPAARPLTVFADRTRVSQIVGNLLQNAAKFTSAGGHTRVSVDADGAQAVVCVVDDGAGMDAETLAGLFQPFVQADHTLDRTRGGLGLGLALVKGLVELHGGTIQAASGGIGDGAQFEVRLPLEAEALQPAEENVAAALKTPRRVLIIEDNRDAADGLRAVLELAGHRVEMANNGVEGLARARAFRPEVVLCDIGLPGMNGYEVARACRADALLKDAFLVALSGYARPEDLRRSADAGFDRHLAKPPSIEALQVLLATAPAAGSSPVCGI